MKIVSVKLSSVTVLISLYFILFLFVNCIRGETKICTPKDIYTCTKSFFTKYNIDLTTQNIFRMGRIFNITSFQQFCRDVELLNDCSHASKLCDDRSKIFLRNIKDIVSASIKLCQLSTDEYVSLFECFSKEPLKNFFGRCLDVAYEDYTNFTSIFGSYENGNSLNQMGIIVSIYDLVLKRLDDCQYYGVRQACSKFEADWLLEYLVILRQPLWKHFSSMYYAKFVYIYLFISLAVISFFITFIFFRSYISHLEEKKNYEKFINTQYTDKTNLVKDTSGIVVSRLSKHYQQLLKPSQFSDSHASQMDKLPSPQTS